MLWAWSESVDLYLGQTLAMVKTSDGNTIVRRHAPTLPLARVLQSLDDVVPKRCQLRISLSAARCPAVEIKVPQGLKRWGELEEIVKVNAAQRLMMPVGEINCEFDSACPGIAASVTTAQLNDLAGWATQSGRSIASIRPLWVIATQCRAAQERSVQGLLLREDDALTLIVNGGKGMTHAVTAPAVSNPLSAQAQLRRWSVSFELSDAEILKLGFAGTPGAAMLKGPKPWAEHWTCA